MIRPQSALLTLYGDYARRPNGEIGIGSLVELLGNFGLSEQAVRSSVSRMCRSKMLKVRRRGKKSYYALTKEGRELLTKGGERIFSRKNGRWDGTWTIVTYSIPEHRRKARDKLRTELRWLGYGPLSEATWISPYDTWKELEDLVEGLKIKPFFQVFHAKHLGFADPKEIVSRCWDLDKTHANYNGFVSKYRTKLREYQKRLENNRPFEPSDYFVERFNLLHEYRKLPFFDPDLPKELLPKKWLRSEAITLFNQYSDLVASGAKRYFDAVIKAYEG
jgi:phenylacetic acid degradation operon negative regulatory protein